VVLRYYLDHSVAETAELMGVPQGTVKSLVARAMVDLRAGLRGSATERGVR
jgi:DNA-directed RNA polymerase specialized sigma24 family protein